MSAPTDHVEDRAPAAPQRQLTLFDSTCIIVGIIIGVFFFSMTPVIASSVPSVAALVGVWALGGLISLIGALSYAELATAYPSSGGDYVYLTRAFGRKLGFVFAWSQLWIVRPGSIGMMAFVFGQYANVLCPLPEHLRPALLYGVGAIVFLSGINILGVREGKWTQNVLTVIKVLGLATIFVIGMALAAPQSAATAVIDASDKTDFRQAMILILIAFGGWNEMAYVGAEVRNPTKNILRALVLGTLAVTAIYVLVTLAFVHALGFEGTRQSEAVAADVLKLVPSLGDWGARFISLLICALALGAINGMIFTGARIYYAMGKDHKAYVWLGQWSGRFGTPVWSLLLQAAITLALVIGFGWQKGQMGIVSLVNFTTPVFWIFFLLIGVSLFVLRYREPHTPRPYRTAGYPLVPLLFCLSSLFMLWASVTWAIDHKSYEAIWAIALLLIGVALSFYERLPRERS